MILLLICICVATAIVAAVAISMLAPRPSYFVSKAYFATVIASSPYFDNMNEYDLSARHSPSKEAYKKTYLDSIKEFSAIEKKRLIKLVKRADAVLKPSFPALYDIPWKFAKVDETIEQGFPHTLGDVIILSNRFLNGHSESYQTNTLIHEKVHVLQRKNPRWAQRVTAEWGFSEYTPNRELPNRRNNPDLSPILYGTNEGPIMQLYTSPSPVSLSDSQAVIVREAGIVPISNDDIGMPPYIHQLEHPYEMMACMIPLLVTGKEITTRVEEILLANMH